ncbi:MULTISPECIES: hypothetical protein [Nostocales]|jgi:hypothetical protein|uniref:Uncharacterized protein n=1 Tax=Dolichospermum flos-aquae UHCC 0037 TaxID=2590026 RepID=A0ACC7SC52_DOLFA|nr:MULTISPECIES: hypothetical protein [Nostocales]MBO1066752.1 hypothetical protein [Anabaena sp. 54]MTJ45791.1 hypothetical protein [Dolichospermum flos-aquae UHCC 0037]
MLSTELQQEFMINRIEKIVAILMEERSLFKEELNPREMVEHLYHIVQQNLTKEQFNNLSEVVYLF